MTTLADTTTFRGAVLAPADPGYSEALEGFTLSTVHRPDLVVRAADAADVVAAVRMARATGRRVAVLATGHGAAAAGPGTVLTRTDALDDVRVDPEARTATVGAGARWQQVLDAAAPHGLGALAGSAPDVGVVGYTLGGGLGPIARTFGLAADRVRSMDVVTADGAWRRVGPGDPLFWALRGGGAAFGLVTGMTFDLVEVGSLYAGGLWFAGDVTHTVVRRWAAWTADLPESVGTSVARVNLPPLPGLPEVLRGRAVVHVRFAHVGDPARGAQLLAPLHDVATPLLDTVGPLPFPALGAIHADPTDPMPVVERGVLLREVPAAAAEAFADVTGPAAGLPFAAAELRLLGGAVGRQPASPNAAAGRSAAFSLHVVGVPVDPAAPAAVEEIVARMAPWATGGAMPNRAGALDAVSAGRIRQAFGPTVTARLEELRAEVDPDGMFTPAARWR